MENACTIPRVRMPATETSGTVGGDRRRFGGGRKQFAPGHHRHQFQARRSSQRLVATAGCGKQPSANR